MVGVLEEAKFFGISGILEQLEEMAKVRLCFLVNFKARYIFRSNRCKRLDAT